MNKTLSTTLIALCGLVTTVLAIAANYGWQQWTGGNIFSMYAFFVIPAGAVVLGAIAASGYYGGSLLFNSRPNTLLLIQMLVITGLAYIAINYLEYSMAVLEDGTYLRDVLFFPAYMQETLTSAHYTIEKSDIGEVGAFGYVLGLLEFLGFMAGGLIIFFALKARLYCQPCQKYLKKLGSFKRRFADFEEFSPHYVSLTEQPLTSMSILNVKNGASAKQKRGAHQLHATLQGCKSCGTQTVEVRVHVMGLTDATERTDLKKAVPVPTNLDLKPAFARG